MGNISSYHPEHTSHLLLEAEQGLLRPPKWLHVYISIYNTLGVICLMSPHYHTLHFCLGDRKDGPCLHVRTRAKQQLANPLL